MAKSNKNTGPAARLPKGFLDMAADEIRARDRMLETIRQVYERYGFEPLETPAIEYTDALGKFLPDQDRPNEGVFSFQDVVPEARSDSSPEQWLSLRYDLTAPLARYVAEGLKEQKLALPFRRYQVGPVWRNEKPGPGRFRQFTQFDADTVGTDNIAADAEICMLAADTLEALGIKRGDYVIKVSNRKILDGLLEAVSIPLDDGATRLKVLRAFDKLDRLGKTGVAQLLGKGRKDESGDFTPGAGLTGPQIEYLVEFFDSEVESWEPLQQMTSPLVDEWIMDPGPDGSPGPWVFDRESMLLAWEDQLRESARGAEGVRELRELDLMCRAAGFGPRRIRISSTVVRGLEYYTGPVFEAEITVPVVNEDGQTVRFGSVGGGGRYDGLVERFMGTKVPATGFSIGVSRLQAALAAINKTGAAAAGGPVVVLVMERDRLADYQKMTQSLRAAGIRAEMYLGTAGMKAQMKYADRRGAPCVVIQGGDERAKGEVQIKDLVEGAKAAATIKDSKEWREGRPAQVSVPEARLVAAVREVLARHKG